MNIKGFKAKDGNVYKYDFNELANLPETPEGEQGADGGYYTPAVTQPTEDTLQFDFTPSKAGMPAVEPVQVKLPAPDSGGNVDLAGYATEQYVKDYAQPKGNYLTEVPEGYAKTEDIPTKPEDIGAQPVGNYLTEVPSDYATKEFVTNKIAEAELGGEEVDLSGYAQKSELPTKVSQLQNDSGYLTAVPDGYAKTEDIPKNAADIGAQPEGDYALRSEIPSVPVKSVNGKTGAVSLTAADVKARPDSWMPTASDVGALPSSTAIPTVPTKLSAFTNDSGYITGYTETDPTVPAWAKQSTKPSYSKSEVGLGNVDNVKQYSASNPPPYPVTSVNGKTGAVTITVPTVPTKVSAFTNDAGYLTESDKPDIVAMVIESLGGNPIFGVVDENNNIIVSGDLPDGTYFVKYEMANGSTVNIGNLVLDSNVYYTVTNTLTNCTSNNSAKQAIGGQSYSATITAKSGYELKTLTVTMGGSPVSVSGGTISIANVTGNIVITAVAEEVKAAEPTNFCVPNGDGWITGGRCSSSGADRTDSATTILTNYIAVQNGDIVYVKSLNISNSTYSGIYKSDKTAIKGFIMTASGGAGYVKDINLSGEWEQFTIDNANAGYIRICGDNEPPYENIIINIKRNGAWL